MFIRYLRPAALLALTMTFILGLLFPALVTAFGAIFFREKAQGSLIYSEGTVIGSRLIGQNFVDVKYFWGRPSATSPQPYNGLASSGSNLGPSNPALLDAVKATVEKFRKADPDNHAAVPVELVTASGSGLDPQISPAAAQFQAGRIALARHVPLSRIQSLIEEHTTPPFLGLMGVPTVNVLELNLALDRLH
jgi:potassium-transporting ATPase KdpC subunit